MNTITDIKVGDIVVNKYNRFSRGLHLKYRVTGFLKIDKYTLVNGIRVKYDRQNQEWVSFGKEHTLLDCYKFADEDSINERTRLVVL